jgi:hypothetical protein
VFHGGRFLCLMIGCFFFVSFAVFVWFAYVCVYLLLSKRSIVYLSHSFRSESEEEKEPDDDKDSIYKWYRFKYLPLKPKNNQPVLSCVEFFFLLVESWNIYFCESVIFVDTND